MFTICILHCPVKTLGLSMNRLVPYLCTKYMYIILVREPNYNKHEVGSLPLYQVHVYHANERTYLTVSIKFLGFIACTKGIDLLHMYYWYSFSRELFKHQYMEVRDDLFMTCS